MEVDSAYHFPMNSTAIKSILINGTKLKVTEEFSRAKSAVTLRFEEMLCSIYYNILKNY